jgi:hypothetical protein
MITTIVERKIEERANTLRKEVLEGVVRGD